MLAAQFPKTLRPLDRNKAIVRAIVPSPLNTNGYRLFFAPPPLEITLLFSMIVSLPPLFSFAFIFLFF